MPYLYYREGNIVLHDYRAIYFFIPKVACTSIKSVCLGLLGSPDTAGNVHKFDYPYVIKDEIDQKYSNYFKFSFVRNPWDRLVSCFRNKIKEDKNYNSGEFRNGIFFKLAAYNMFWAGMPFDAFVDAVCLIRDEQANPHFRSQCAFITDDKGKIFVDFIGRFEQLDADFRTICTRINVSDDCLPHLMVGGAKKDYKELYTDKTKNQVAARYARDIAMFDYEY